MPATVAPAISSAERARVLATIHELAGDGLADRMRLEAVARAVVTARRWHALSPRRNPSGPLAAKLMRAADAWDPVAMTAIEYAETLRPAAAEGLLAAARHWAAMVQAAETKEFARAA